MKRTRLSKSSPGRDAQIKPEQEGEMETHIALLNDVVLQNIFKYLSFSDLKSCRDVKNSRWLFNSKKAWLFRTKVTFKGKTHLAAKIEDYLNQSELKSTVTNYKFRRCSGIHEGFLNSVGHSIKYLELVKCSFPTVDAFRNLIYTRCPNLEKLLLEKISFETIPETDILEPLKWQKPQLGEHMNVKFLKVEITKLPLSWMELLSHFPNLQALEALVDYVDIYKVISRIRQHDPRKLKLNHIDTSYLFQGYEEESLRSVLLNPDLSFETIRLNLGICRPETLQDILDFHAESLKELYIFGESIFHSGYMQSPQPLHNLEELYVRFCRITPDIFKYTPNVRKIDLTYEGRNNLLNATVPGFINDSCKELTINYYGRWGHKWNMDLAFFVNAFPNVETLVIRGVGNVEFSMICEKWTKLVSLTVLDSRVDTLGLLGFDPYTNGKNGSRKPNITDLKDLRSFSMSSEDRSRMLSGFVVFQEVEGIPHLKKFELKNYQLKWGKSERRQLASSICGNK